MEGKSILRQYDQHFDVLFIVFGGYGGGIYMPPFEFYNILNRLRLPVNMLYVRDLHQMWYFNGLKGVTKSLEDTAQFLRWEIDSQSPNKVVTIGASMGGYAAILFGGLLCADLSIAFAPQTCITKEHCGDPGNPLSGMMAKLWNKFPEHQFFDITEIVKRNKVEIHCSDGNGVKWMRDTGALDILLTKAAERKLKL